MVLASPFAALLDAARAGDDDAWRTIYRSLAPKILGYLRARGVPDAEDVLGEIFLQVVRDLGRFEGDEADFRSWVFSIAHNRMLDDVRRRARRPIVLDGIRPSIAEQPQGDAEAEAIESLTNEDIRAVLSVLSPDQQSVLLLRLFAGMTAPQIAAAMGKTEGAVKALQHRGLEGLRRALARSLPRPGAAIGKEGA